MCIVAALPLYPLPISCCHILGRVISAQVAASHSWAGFGSPEDLTAWQLP